MFPLFKLAERNAVMTGLEGCSFGTTGEYCKRYASDEEADLVLSYFARKTDYCNICYDAVCDTLDNAIAFFSFCQTLWTMLLMQLQGAKEKNALQGCSSN